MQEFRVSPNGYIYVARGNLDREKMSSYNFHLIAIDSGVPPLSSTTQVHIYVTDVNDNSPTWQFPAHNNQAVNLTVSEPVGYRLAQLSALDPDEGENGEVTYRLVQTSVLTVRDDSERANALGQKGGAEQGGFGSYHPNEPNYIRPSPLNRQAAGNLFELDPSSGSIYVGRSMSLDDIGTVKLVVEARDHGKPPRVNHRVLHVNILRYMTQTSAFNSNGGDEPGLVGTDKSRHRTQNSTSGSHIENDLIVIVIMVAVTLIISLALIIAILFLRCGACPSRNAARYNPSEIQDYRHNISTTHHLEEVFRDSGALGADGILPGGLDSMSNCNHPNDATLSTYHTNTENEPMFRSYLSTHGANDTWLLPNISPRKAVGQTCDTLNCPRGTITRVQAPCIRDENNKLINTIGPERRVKRMDDGTFGSASMTDSPDHEMHLMVSKRGLTAGKHTAVPCSTFRASCSHLTGARSTTPCKPTGKLLLGLMKESSGPSEMEDIDSMDSGHGCSVDNGTSAPCDPLSQRPRSSNQVTTFRCYTPSSCSDNGDFDRLERANLGRPRSGTLPSAFNLNDDPLIGQCDSKSQAELAEIGKIPSSRSQPSHLVRARQSVTWLDPTYQTCERGHSPGTVCERNQTQNQHSTTCPHYVVNTDLTPTATDRGTLVMLNPVDRLGYAQLVHSSSGLCDRNSPAQNAYSSFPTSFV
ncbi:unnamed protein product [Echinostoma caproni]|uniref:Cadherin domain-containing protein n=1 Tax=Echinostoma caproni TaxID=27848 RepID=A0A183AFZ8_9TREM|nr:unnamed protein product [Echinostoma caproni]